MTRATVILTAVIFGLSSPALAGKGGGTGGGGGGQNTGNHAPTSSPNAAAKKSTTPVNVDQVKGSVFVSARAATARGPRRVRPKPIEY
jgi:hypothetical protein